jgi:hypothetical protein
MIISEGVSEESTSENASPPLIAVHRLTIPDFDRIAD